MIGNFFSQLYLAVDTLRVHLPFTLGILCVILLAYIANVICRGRLNRLGIWPRRVRGLIGIPLCPVLHGDFSHLMFNVFPLFVFINFVLLQGLMVFIHVSLIIIVLSGVLIWLFGRPGIHIGASALIMGYLGYIAVNIYVAPNVLSIIVGVVCLYYFGGLIINLLPSDNRQVSWEGHVCGFVAGVVAAVL